MTDRPWAALGSLEGRKICTPLTDQLVYVVIDDLFTLWHKNRVMISEEYNN